MATETPNVAQVHTHCVPQPGTDRGHLGVIFKLIFLDTFSSLPRQEPSGTGAIVGFPGDDCCKSSRDASRLRHQWLHGPPFWFPFLRLAHVPPPCPIFAPSSFSFALFCLWLCFCIAASLPATFVYVDHFYLFQLTAARLLCLKTVHRGPTEAKHIEKFENLRGIEAVFRSRREFYSRRRHLCPRP